MNNMLMFYYPISKKHFEENNESLGNCIETNCDGKDDCGSSTEEQLIDIHCEHIALERKKIVIKKI
jgi:hypothetical protein